MNNILEKQYLKVEFKLLSPLSIGSGKNEKTDHDLLLNSRGVPYIPGSAIAGVFREACMKVMDEGWIQNYFGTMNNENVEEVEIRESQFKIYDAKIQTGEYFVSRRDGVALDIYKYSIPGAKFDREVLESGVTFCTYLEREINKPEELDAFDQLAEILYSVPIAFGGKTSRGYGRAGEFQINKKVFSFDTEGKTGTSGEQWLEFNMYQENCWKKSISLKGVRTDCFKGKKLILELALQGAISIRQYTTETGDGTQQQVPDMKQLTVRQKQNGGAVKEIPVIPGTTWAGAIGHRMQLFYPSSSKFFGSGGEQEKERSRIFFSESQLENHADKVLSRNAIDRFTAGTVDGALFTEKISYGGTTVLEIYLDPRAEKDKNFVAALAAALADLHEGFLAVGGGTAVGRGIFQVQKVNGLDFSGDGSELYKRILRIFREGA